MKLSSPRRIRIALAAMASGVALSFHSPIHAQIGPKNEVAERLKAEASALLKAGIPLPPEAFEQKPLPETPATIKAAGEEFVQAWGEYQRALLVKVSSNANAPAASSRGKNVRFNMSAYENALKALLESDTPPQPEEIGQFFYDDYTWCGTDSSVFADPNRDAVLLACLRNKRYGEAVRILSAMDNKSEVKETLLTALGFNFPKLLAGAWLSGVYGNLEALCQKDSIYGSQLAIRWAELHWNEAVNQQKTERTVYQGQKPQIPTLELVNLLRDDAGTPETKRQISEFLSKSATRLFEPERWLQRARPDAAKWLMSIAREALHSEKNSARKLGEKVLQDAGEKDIRAELTPAPSYRLYVDGQLWYLDELQSNSILGLNVYQGNGELVSEKGMSPSQTSSDDSITLDPDSFPASKNISRAYLDSYPRNFAGAVDKTMPWIRAELPLPPAFGKTTDIRIETVPLTIEPKLPRPAAEYEGKTMELDFHFAENDQPPSEGAIYETGTSCPFVIERVQPGEYWYRVRAPGAVTGVWQRIRVTPKANLIQLKLERGSQVSVPYAWPADLDLEKLHPDIAAILRREWTAGLPDYFVLKKDGKPYEFPPPRRQLSQQYPKNPLIFPGLPPGKYTLKLRSSNEVLALIPFKSESSGKYAGWKSAAITFAITAKSPIEFQTDTLKIQLTK